MGVGSQSPLPGIFPSQAGVKPRSPALKTDSLPSEPPINTIEMQFTNNKKPIFEIFNLVSFEKYINLKLHQKNQDKKYFPSSQKILISFSSQFLPPKATATLNSVSTEYLACCFACHPFYINEII